MYIGSACSCILSLNRGEVDLDATHLDNVLTVSAEDFKCWFTSLQFLSFNENEAPSEHMVY